jgi:homoserine O-acetyltransferase
MQPLRVLFVGKEKKLCPLNARAPLSFGTRAAIDFEFGARRLAHHPLRFGLEWRNYTRPAAGWVQGYEILRTMIDGVTHLQAATPDGAAADDLIANVRKQAAAADANDLLLFAQVLGDYGPQPGLGFISMKVFELNFSDDQSNPQELHVLEHLMPKVQHERFVIQSGSEKSFGSGGGSTSPF